MSRVIDIEVVGRRKQGQPKTQVEKKIKKEDVIDREKWRTSAYYIAWNTR